MGFPFLSYLLGWKLVWGHYNNFTRCRWLVHNLILLRRWNSICYRFWIEKKRHPFSPFKNVLGKKYVFVFFQGDVEVNKSTRSAMLVIAFRWLYTSIKIQPFWYINLQFASTKMSDWFNVSKKILRNAEDSNANNLVGFELRHLLSIIGQPRYPSGRLSASVFLL